MCVSFFHWLMFSLHTTYSELLYIVGLSDLTTHVLLLLLQTPLHLAALRGNTAVVEHMIMHCGADCTKKDRNGLNPLELSVKKKQLKTEWALRKLTYKGMFAVALSLGLNRLKDPT